MHKPTFLLSMTAQNKMQNNICVRHIAYHFICHTYVALINSQFYLFQFSTLWFNLFTALCRHMVLFKKYLLWKFTKVLLVTLERDISSCFLYTRELSIGCFIKHIRVQSWPLFKCDAFDMWRLSGRDQSSAQQLNNKSCWSKGVYSTNVWNDRYSL